MSQSALAADDADAYLAFAAELADSVRPILLSHFRGPLDVISKSDDSPVTIADRAAKLHLRDRIQLRFPGHGIVGEETGGAPSGAFNWILDPIDGTRASSPAFRYLEP